MSFEESTSGLKLLGKNIVLETMYAMAHRIQELMTSLLFAVRNSLTPDRKAEYDPVTVSCALWIVYSSLNKFQKLTWDAKSLQNLVSP